MKNSSVLFYALVLILNPFKGGSQNIDSKSKEAIEKDVVIDVSTYRLGASNDGNMHDMDDILDVAMEIALCAEAGIKDKLTHIDYSNHLGENDPVRAREMSISAKGTALLYDVSESILFDCQENLEGAIKSIAHQINISTADNPFFYNVSGPMEVPYRGIMASNPEKRKYAYAISHSEWNDNHTDTDEMSHTWEDIKKTGINCIHIKNQDKNKKMQSDYSVWDWLETSNNPNWKWIWLRSNIKCTFDEEKVKHDFYVSQERERKFDASGTGIMWFIITGRSDEDGDSQKFKKVFQGDFKTKTFKSHLNLKID